jgi:hypothetical protein
MEFHPGQHVINDGVNHYPLGSSPKNDWKIIQILEINDDTILYICVPGRVNLMCSDSVVIFTNESDLKPVWLGNVNRSSSIIVAGEHSGMSLADYLKQFYPEETSFCSTDNFRGVATIVNKDTSQSEQLRCCDIYPITDDESEVVSKLIRMIIGPTKSAMLRNTSNSSVYGD